jgi:hypothetical protein
MKPACRWICAAIAAAAVCGTALPADSFVTFAATTPALEKRHALVVGNSAYSHGALKNPLNDARAVARALAGSGFEVVLLEDATRAAMQRAIRRFGEDLLEGGVGLFYYAGHGMQVKGRNFLVPVNADIDREYEVEFNALDVNLVLSMMDDARNALNIVILDACRTNPFARSLRVSASGLAPMDAPVGTIIAFATAPGAVASDGTGANGVYTKHLLEHLAVPGLPIEQLFKKVRIGVIKETGGEQTPWESSSLRGEFAFRRAPAGVVEGRVEEDLIVEALRREREANRRLAETLIQDALERQRRLFDSQRRAVPPAPPQRDGMPSQGAEQDAAILSRYLSQRRDFRDGASLPRLTMLDEQACKPQYVCSARGRVVGSQTVRVHGGSFGTTKVIVQQSWQPRSVEPGASSQNAELWGSRVLTVWYSREAGRVLRLSSRQTYGRSAPMAANFDFDLAADQLPASQVASKGETR